MATAILPPRQRARAAIVLILAAVYGVGSQLPAAGPATAPSPMTLPADAIQRAIRDLSSDEFAIRDTADKKLRTLGWSAMTDLIIANAEVTGAEAKTRIAAIIRAIATNHTGLDKETTDQLKKYEAADENARRWMRFDQDEAGFIRAQIQILSAGDLFSHGYNANGGEAFADRYSKELQKAGAWDELQWNQITSTLLHHSSSDGGYARVIWLARKQGNADHLARALLALRKIQPRENYQQSYDEMLMQLLIASGNAEEVLKTADSCGIYGDLARLLFLSERHDWAAIANLPPDKKNENLYDRAAALQYMGRRAEADALLNYENKPLEENAVNISGNHPMLLGRMDLSNRLFVNQADYPDAILFLTMQHRYSEIPAVVEKAKAAKDRQAQAVESLLIPVYARLNEVDRVRALVKALSGKGDALNREWIREAIIEAQTTLGAVDIGANPAVESVSPMPGVDARSMEEQMWIEALKGKPGESSDTLKEVARILGDKPTPQQIEQLVAYAPEIPPDLRASPEVPVMQAQVGLWKAYILHKASRNDLAEKAITAAIKALQVEVDAPLPEEMKDPAQAALYRKHLRRMSQVQLAQIIMGDERFALPTADFLVDLILADKDWKFSKSVLEALAAEDGVGDVLKYLLGVCLEKLGDVQHGASLKTQAEDLLDGDLRAHSYLAKILSRMGEVQLARHHAQLVLDLDLDISETRYDTHDLLAQMSINSGEYADALDHLRLVAIDKFHYFRMPEDRTVYIRIPRQMAYCEARVAIAKNDPAAALETAKPVPTIDCEDLTLTLQLIAAFEAAKFNDQGAALAAHNRALLEAILKDFPNSHLHHYLIAKLDLDSGFTSDKTQPHLAKALELAPKNPDYLALQKRTEKH